MDLDRYRIEKTGKKSEGKRFSFLSDVTQGIDGMFQRVNQLLYMVARSKPYAIDHEHLEKEYLAHGVGDIDEFASNYTVSWSFKVLIEEGKEMNRPSKQAFYEEVRDHLWQKKINGQIL